MIKKHTQLFFKNRRLFLLVLFSFFLFIALGYELHVYYDLSRQVIPQLPTKKQVLSCPQIWESGYLIVRIENDKCIELFGARKDYQYDLPVITQWDNNIIWAFNRNGSVKIKILNTNTQDLYTIFDSENIDSKSESSLVDFIIINNTLYFITQTGAVEAIYYQDLPVKNKTHVVQLFSGRNKSYSLKGWSNNILCINQDDLDQKHSVLAIDRNTLKILARTDVTCNQKIKLVTPHHTMSALEMINTLSLPLNYAIASF